MRENEQRLNKRDERKQIELPVLLSVLALAVLAGILVWLAVREPNALSGIRDLLITLIVFLSFVIGIALAVLFFWLSSRLGGAREAIDKVLSQADGKTEELAEKITDILRSILNPFIEIGAGSAGVRGVFTGKNTEDKNK